MAIKKNNVTKIDMISATITEIHIPLSSNTNGRHKTAITWNTSVLRKAINAETNPSFRAIKNDVLITDMSGKLVSTFKAFPSSPSAGRSFTGNILLLDEWAFQEYAEEIWTSAYPTINRPTGGKVIGLSTIKKGTLFESLWIENNAFHKIFLSVFSDPRRTQEWYERTAKDLGVMVKQEYPRTAEEALSNLGGSYFPEFDYSKHTCEPFRIPEDWTIYRRTFTRL